MDKKSFLIVSDEGSDFAFISESISKRVDQYSVKATYEWTNAEYIDRFVSESRFDCICFVERLNGEDFVTWLQATLEGQARQFNRCSLFLFRKESVSPFQYSSLSSQYSLMLLHLSEDDCHSVLKLVAKKPAAELNLFQSSLLLGALQNCFSVPMCVKNSKSEYVFWNEEFLNLTGSEEDILGMTDFNFFYMHYAQITYDDEQRSRRTKERQVFEEDCIFPDRSERGCSRQVLPILSSKNTWIGTIVVYQFHSSEVDET